MSIPNNRIFVARAEKWQKVYYRAADPQGQDVTGAGHRTRLRLRPFLKP